MYNNPNTFTGLVGKVRKKTISRRRKEGRVEKKRAAPPLDPGLEPGTCRVLGEGPQLHARGLFRHASLSVPIDRVGRLATIAQHHVLRVLEIVFVRFCKIL